MNMRRAFTLMEVNLAILVMAGGILSTVSLFSLGFRESRQSNEDVASAAYADSVMAPLAIALSSKEISWSDFNSIDNQPSSEGWGAYLDSRGKVQKGTTAKAQGVFSSVMSKLSRSGVSSSFPTGAAAGDLKAGLVILHEENSPVVKIAFRAMKQESQLMSAPLYYTEVHFQGMGNE